MKLEQYLGMHKISVVDFAERVGVSPSIVYRWINGAKIPRARHLRMIARLTRGAVTPNDFFGIASPAGPEIEEQRRFEAGLPR
jgi:DNA-binding transcriptional regulator YdaS (Cro superfamily)